MKASLVTYIVYKGLTQIERLVQKLQSFEKKKCFFSTVRSDKNFEQGREIFFQGFQTLGFYV